MKQRTATRFFSAAVALLAIASWLVASNHCAVASLLPAPVQVESSQDHCSGHATPEKGKKKGGCDEKNCCKSLSVPAPAVAKILVGYDNAFFAAKDYSVADQLFAGELHEAAIWEVDTGPPPHSQSFAESVLQRSLRAHAPPVLG